MPIRSLFRSNAATTIFLLVLPFLLLSFSSYCGDDDGEPSSDTYPSDIDPGPDSGPPDVYNDVDPPPDSDNDLEPTGGACCWGPIEDPQCGDIAESACDGVFYPGESCAQYSCGEQDLTADPFEDLFDSISEALATFSSGYIDISGVGIWIIPEEEAMRREVFNIDPEISCGSDTDGVRVLCVPPMMGGPTPMPDADVLMATMKMFEAIPAADSDHSLVYTLACESDGDSANDWVYVSPYDWDTYQATDRWYMVKWIHPNQTWRLEVMQVNSSQQQLEVGSTTARAVIDGDTIRFFISMEEFSNNNPACRFVTFGHDGSWNPDDRGSDCDGANPTLPLMTPLAQ